MFVYGKKISYYFLKVYIEKSYVLNLIIHFTEDLAKSQTCLDLNEFIWVSSSAAIHLDAASLFGCCHPENVVQETGL